MGSENDLIRELRKALKAMDSGNLLLVGGSVRDLLLGRSLLDYDFIWDGEMEALINVLSERLPHSRVRINSQLYTASYDTPWGRLDISRARKECYPSPGSMPKIIPVSWAEDLSRRDFTINALALALRPDGWGEVIDNFGGLKDLQKRLIRFLHPLSFQDDPTRILRGIRLKNRLGFAWEKETRDCLIRDWPYLRLVSPARRYKEWELICREESPGEILGEIYSLGGWEFFFAGLPYEPQMLHKIADSKALDAAIANEAAFRHWLYNLLILLGGFPGSAEELARYWGLSPLAQEKLVLALSLAEKVRQGQGQGWQDRLFTRELQKLSCEGLYYVYQIGLDNCGPEKQGYLPWDSFKGQVKDTKPPIKGRDLLQLDFPPGKEMGNLLQQLEESFWRNEYSTKAEGLSLAQELFRRTDNV